jgi:hypothetical protein
MILDPNLLARWLWPLAIVVFILLVMMSSASPAACPILP